MKALKADESTFRESAFICIPLYKAVPEKAGRDERGNGSYFLFRFLSISLTFSLSTLAITGLGM